MNGQQNPSRGALADMITGRRGMNSGSAEALVRQIGQPPVTALPSSTPQSGMPQVPASGGNMQLVTGRDGAKYQIVIDPKTGLQTFIPYREPAQQPQQPNRMMAGAGQPPMGGQPAPMGRMGGRPTLGDQRPMGGQPAPGGQGLANRLRNMLSS